LLKDCGTKLRQSHVQIGDLQGVRLDELATRLVSWDESAPNDPVGENLSDPPDTAFMEGTALGKASDVVPATDRISVAHSE
jgi:hypothetical protein